jgi:hypothetical protein
MRNRMAILIVVVVAVGCIDDIEGEHVEGSGTVVTENREIGDFDRIAVEGFGRVIVEVGPAVSLTVAAEDNILPLLVAKVDGSTLSLTTKPNTSFRNVEEPVYTITVPALVGVSISGSGDVTVTGLKSDTFTATISGSGDIRPTGEAGSLDVSISGSGGFHGENLAVADAEVDVSGSGSVVVNATDSLDVSIGGSGSVRYLGDPVVTQSTGGSGSVERG